MIKCGCGNEIHPERYELGYKICLSCGDQSAARQKPYGTMIYTHKTGGSIQITNKTLYNVYKKVTHRSGKKSNVGNKNLKYSTILFT